MKVRRYFAEVSMNSSDLHLCFLAPNIYRIPTVLGSSKEGQIPSAPAFSITGKLKNKLPQCVQFPGELSA
jgi:hypothetical protein